MQRLLYQHLKIKLLFIFKKTLFYETVIYGFGSDVFD